MDWAMKLVREMRELEADIAWIKRKEIHLGDANYIPLINEANRRLDSYWNDLCTTLENL